MSDKKKLWGGRFQQPTDTFVDPNDLEFYLLGWLQGAPSRAAPHFPPNAGLIGAGGYRLDTTPPEVSE